MDASFALGVARRRIPALLAGTALAAASVAGAETRPAQLNVSVLIQPSCAVSARARLDRPASGEDEEGSPEDVLEIACTNGATWFVDAPTTESAQVDGANGITGRGLAALPRKAGAEDAAIANIVRITVRY